MKSDGRNYLKYFNLKRCLTITVLLFLLAELICLIVEAASIRENVLDSITVEEQSLFDEVQTLAGNEDADLADWQEAMIGNTTYAENESGYRWQSVSMIQTQPDLLLVPVVESANALIIRYLDTDGEWQQLTVLLQDSNQLQVARLFSDCKSGAICGTGSTITFTGWWSLGAFYADSYTVTRNADGEVLLYFQASEAVINQDAGDFCEITFGEVKDSYGTLYEIEPVMKSTGRQSPKNPVKSWEKADELLSGLNSSYLVETLVADGTQIRKSILKTTLKSAMLFQQDENGILYRTVDDYLDRDGDNLTAGHSSGQYVVCYSASFSPLLLALKQRFSHGHIPAAFLVLLVGCLMTLFLQESSSRKKITTLTEENARQKTALDYASHAEQSRREMTSAIAHELKTPIAVLSGYAEALQEGVAPEKEQHYLSVIREEADSMNRLVMELLDLSRLEAGKYRLNRENFDMRKLAEEIVEPLEQQISEKNLQIKWVTKEVMVSADRFRMGQVIQNLMTNAIRHTPENGKIILRFGINHNAFSVENEGSHLTQEQLEKVFESFWQGDSSRNSSGTGLGLTLCKTIMELHGGSCRAENTALGVQFVANLNGPANYTPGKESLRETLVALDYPIAQDSTTVGSVLTHLNLLNGKQLKNQIQEGAILANGIPVKNEKEKLCSGMVLQWMEFQITIRQDDGLKRQALIQNSLTPGGGLAGHYQRGIGGIQNPQ